MIYFWTFIFNGREKKIYHFLTEKATATNITITNFDATTLI